MNFMEMPDFGKGINVLGISLGSDSGAALVSSRHGLLCATNEERYSRKKQTKEFPFKSISHVLSTTCIKRKDIHAIAISHYADICAYDLIKYNREYIEHIIASGLFTEANHGLADEIHEFWSKCESDEDYALYSLNSEYGKNLGVRLLKYMIGDVLGTTELPEIARIKHHVAHAFSAWGTSGFDMDELCLMFTMDGFGDGESMAFHELKASDNTFRTVESAPLVSSLGLLYQFTTGAVGYKMHEQEGKLTGLAARGTSLYTDEFLNIIDSIQLEEGYNGLVKKHSIINFDLFEKYRDMVFSFVGGILNKRGNTVEVIADIAASLQQVVETCTLHFISHFMKQCAKPTNVCLAGGLFANVVINQKVAKLPNVKKLWICPHMGDGGTSVGAAFAHLYTTTNIHCNKLNTIYMGYHPLHDEIKWAYSQLLPTSNMVKCDNKPRLIAEYVKSGYIVANYAGGMEWGPRALCNRSIHFNCADKDVSLWLNRQLGRTETMPFAPVICDVDAKYMFLDYNDVTKEAAKYMTINFTATDVFKELCPGAVHVDGTVRAQVVSREDHPVIHDALIQYKRLTGMPAFINTSFNAHGEPIIRTPEEAVTRFLESNIHVLFLGDYVLLNPNIKSLPIFKSETGENKDNPGNDLN